MSELEMECPLGACKKWEPQDFRGNPLPDGQRGFRQPDTVEVKKVVPAGDRKLIAEIVPDLGCNGIEWSMTYTMPLF